MLQGQVRKAISGFYYIYQAGNTYQTRARGNFRKQNISPLVGDYVNFESSSATDGYVLEVLPRKNQLLRPPVANVDQAIIVMSSTEPKFSSNLLDRYLLTIEQAKIQPVLYFSKIDLLDATELANIKRFQAIYQAIGYPVFLGNSLGEVTDLQELIASFAGKVSVFMGQSGAGKSTLLNKLSPQLQLKTAPISNSLGRGKHTTRHVELLPLFEGLLGDTPGFSAIDVTKIKATELSQLFPEMKVASQACKFRGCLHQHEPSCAVKQQVDSGIISLSRYQNYLQFLTEIEEQKPIYGKEKEK